MLHTELVYVKATEALEKNGPMAFLDLADLIAPECKIGLRPVERELRVLLGLRKLIIDDKHRVVLAGEQDGRRGNGHCQVEQDRARSASA